MDDATHADVEAGPATGRLLFRLAVGLAQGLALAYLIRASEQKIWPATDLYIFTPLIVVTCLWPPLLLVGATMRRASFVSWAIVAVCLLTGLTYYDIWRAGDPKGSVESLALYAALVPLFFIMQSLISAADADGRLIAHYTTYFDTAWKLGLQAVLGMAFVALLWIVLRIGAELFLLIKLDFLKRLIENRWFYIPAMTLAFAYAIDLTDVRAGLIRGVRTLALMLQSWILPVMALLTVAFLAALPLTGVEVLWQTKTATALLLAQRLCSSSSSTPPIATARAGNRRSFASRDRSAPLLSFPWSRSPAMRSCCASANTA
jgi:hypothetical protein